MPYPSMSCFPFIEIKAKGPIMQTLPATYRKLVATRHGKDYHSITEVVEVPLEQPGPGKVLIQNHYAGVNASDINITSGAYGGLPPLPMDLGVEAVGTVVAIGEGVNGVRVGDAVAYLQRGAYGEYNTLSERDRKSTRLNSSHVKISYAV